ncbi:MAG: UTP--glucose-1-phosphate uridylyltransferase [Actinomycetota bacterium]
MTSDVAQQLASLPQETRDRLRSYGFDPDWFLRHVERMRGKGRADNIVRGKVEPPRPDDIVELPPSGSEERARLEEKGLEVMSEGGCAIVVLAGGMATRMGGVVKALVEALPGRSFLDLRLAGHRAMEERVGQSLPFWLMTSHATDEAIRAALGDRLDGYHIATFPQMVSLRLDPDGSLFLDDEGLPSHHSPGHGDLPEALQRSGLLDEFISRGGRYVTTANLDNIGATLDPALVGMQVETGAALMCEIADKEGTDRGGIPARLDGRPLILEELRIPESFDPAQVRVFNTNTFHFEAGALRDLEMEWTYFVVEKEVDGRPAIQFERIINEVAAHLDSVFVHVPRQGPESRFLPVKDDEALAARRPLLAEVAAQRGMI